MPICPQCARDLEDAGALCAACEREATTVAPLPAQSEPDEGSTPGVPPASSADDATPPPAGWSSRHVGAAAFAVVVGAITVGLGGLRHQGNESVPAAEHASMIGNTRTGRRASAARTVHEWSDANSARWVSNYRRSIAYELAAENTASAGQTRVRPVLVVRCLGNVTEAFVFTQWPAAIEPDDTRTTHVSFDEDADATEHWLTSDSRDALFAPDGVAFARRLAHGRTLRFGFTPHNGLRQTIEFHVAGFDAHVETVARLCRWK